MRKSAFSRFQQSWLPLPAVIGFAAVLGITANAVGDDQGAGEDEVIGVSRKVLAHDSEQSRELGKLFAKPSRSFSGEAVIRLSAGGKGEEVPTRNEGSPAPSPETGVDTAGAKARLASVPFVFHRDRKPAVVEADLATGDSSNSAGHEQEFSEPSTIEPLSSPAPTPESDALERAVPKNALKPFVFHRGQSAEMELEVDAPVKLADSLDEQLSESAVPAAVDLSEVPEELVDNSTSGMKLDYIFTNPSSNIALDREPVPLRPVELEEAEELPTPETGESRPAALVEKSPEAGFVESPPMGALTYDVPDLDHLDPEPVAKIEEVDGDSPSRSDTLVETRVDERPPAPSRESGFTSFDNGFIPEFEDELKLVDEDPDHGTYATTDTYANERLPDSWRLPPGQTVPGYPRYPANSARYYGGYPAYGAGGYPGGSYTGGGSEYRGNAYGYESDPSYYSRSYYPGGPYGYEYVAMNYYGSDRVLYEDTHFSLEGDVPLFTRKFNPDEAHFKIAGLYFQALSLEFGALYSDYDGPVQFQPGDEDGFLAFVGFRFRAAARISPALYLTLDGTVLYLMPSNRVAFRSGANGSPFLTLAYEDQWGEWDIRAFDSLGFTYPFLFGSDALERAGRYQFGFAGFFGGSNYYTYDPIIYNRIGVEAARPVNTDWRLTLGAYQNDYWLTDSRIRDDHGVVQSLSAQLDSDGRFVPFSPWARYRATSADYFDSHVNIFTVGGQGRLTERTSLSAMFGYLTPSGLPTDSDHYLWRIALRNEISPRTSHGVLVGNGYFESDFSDETVVSEYVQYYINHEFTETLTGYAFAQWSSDEFLTGRLVGGDFDREMYGFRLTERVSETVTAGLGYLYEERRNSRTGIEQERHIFDANINARMARDMTGYLRYRYEDTVIFDESLYSLGVRKYF